MIKSDLYFSFLAFKVSLSTPKYLFSFIFIQDFLAKIDGIAIWRDFEANLTTKDCEKNLVKTTWHKIFSEISQNICQNIAKKSSLGAERETLKAKNEK